MATCEKLANELEPKFKNYSNFKIGKTGQTIEDRYNQEYWDDYSFYEVIGNSTEAEDVDLCEKYLIERFLEFPNCDNDHIGGGEMTESERYIVYVVYNN